MATSLYDLTVPVFVHALGSLSAFLEKGRADAVARGFDPQNLLSCRLYPDMAALAYQVQRCSDTAKGAVIRLSGMENVAFEDNEVTFDDLQARIAKTVDLLKSVRREEIDGQEEKTVVLNFPNATLNFTGRDYVLGFAMPNFYFHMTTAYALLRHQGVPVGKRDFMGGM